MAVNQYKYDFFISYAEDARDWVDTYLVARLEREGKRFLREKNFEVGQGWVAEAERAVEQSHKVIVVLTPDYVTSRMGQLVQWMTHTKGAEERNWPLFPILLKPVNRALLLRSLNIVDLTQPENRESAVSSLIAGLRDDNIDLDQAPPKCPYPGMAPFGQEDTDRFFGREDEINRYVTYLQNNGFLVLIGSSGCGKSSLVSAGIIPALKKNPRYAGSVWAVRHFRPSDQMFLKWVKQAGDPEQLGYVAWLENLQQQNNQANCLLVFIDQFEELFSLDKTDKDEGKATQLGYGGLAFLQNLQTLVRLALEVKGNIFVVLTVRDDFFSQLVWCGEWWLNYLSLDSHLKRISSLGRRGLADAIRKPAAREGVWVDDVLVERLVTDAGDDPGILPFVQETMRELWGRMKADVWYISLKSYEALGEGSTSGLRSAIRNKADAAYNSLSSDQHKDVAKRIFVRLIQFGEGRADTRRQQFVSELRSVGDRGDIFETVLDHLSSDKYRLLVFGKDGERGVKVDIVHESLISGWPLLESWVGGARKLEKVYRGLQYDASKWHESLGGSAGFLDSKEIELIRPVWTQLIDSGVSEEVNSFWEASNRNIKYMFVLKIWRSLLSIIFFVGLVLIVIWGYSWDKNRQAKALSPQVKVPSGYFLFGHDDRSISDGTGIVRFYLDDFWIDKYEVTNSMFCLCSKAWVCERGNFMAHCDDGNKNLPVVNVSLASANKYCQWVGKRLPLEVEWEKAAKGVGVLLPDVELVNVLSGVPVDIYKLGLDVNSIGLFGMYGNVSEWTLSPYIDYVDETYNKIYWSEDMPIEDISLRGGGFDSGQVLDVAFRVNRNSSEGYPDVGFRCVTGRGVDRVLVQLK